VIVELYWISANQPVFSRQKTSTSKAAGRPSSLFRLPEAMVVAVTITYQNDWVKSSSLTIVRKLKATAPNETDAMWSRNTWTRIKKANQARLVNEFSWLFTSTPSLNEIDPMWSRDVWTEYDCLQLGVGFEGVVYRM
jgi:hypothetical protein